MRYHFLLIRMATIWKKKGGIINVGEYVEKLEPLCITDGNVKWCSHYGKQFGGFSIAKHRITI